MCMKSVNMTTAFYEDDLSGINGVIKYGEMISQVTAKTDNEGNHYIDRLYIFTAFSAISSKEEDPDLTNKYDVMWTLGDLNETVFDNKIITEQIIDAAKNKISNPLVSARNFSNQSIVPVIKNFKVDRPGKYYLKIYIKKHIDMTIENNDNNSNDAENIEWQIQSINSIDVKFE